MSFQLKAGNVPYDGIFYPEVRFILQYLLEGFAKMFCLILPRQYFFDMLY